LFKSKIARKESIMIRPAFNAMFFNPITSMSAARAQLPALDLSRLMA
jgi:hypothetical protein